MNPVVAIIGAGYVGMQMAAMLSNAGLRVIAFDKSQQRIDNLIQGFDNYNELKQIDSSSIEFSSEVNALSNANYYIITLPTPINIHSVPDLKYIKDGAKLIASVLKKKDVVIFESTVFPGATEDVMIPILESISGLKSGRDFYVGYSPERVVPGDELHNYYQDVKVISGQNNIALQKIEALYQDLLSLKLHVAPSIKVAESCKLLENIQRDVNVALMNEFSQIMGKMDIKMEDVLAAAQTKWNFLPFKPGFVGGHCIPLDPYYLIYQAHQYGASSNLISTARDVNEHFPDYIFQILIQLLSNQDISISGAKVGLFGISFKPNVSDTRHSLSVKLYQMLQGFNMRLYAYDPLVTIKNDDLNWVDWEAMPRCNAIVLIQQHDVFIQNGLKKLIEKLDSNGVFMDLPGTFHKQSKDYPQITYWNL